MFEANNLAKLPYEIASQLVNFIGIDFKLTIVFFYMLMMTERIDIKCLSVLNIILVKQICFFMKLLRIYLLHFSVFNRYNRLKQTHHMCTQYLGFFTNTDILARHKQL